VATIKDVARLAGVAISTASNALNGNPGIKKETRERIIQTAKSLNYIPNPIARGLVSRKTRNICTIVSGSKYNSFSNPVYYETIKSFANKLKENKYLMSLSYITAADEREYFRHIVADKSCDAIFMIGPSMKEEEIDAIFCGKLPILKFQRKTESKGVYSISFNNFKGAYMATEYLISMGHKHIGFIGIRPNVSLAEDRFNGYSQALSDYGIALDNSIIVEGDYYQESGLLGMKEILRSSKNIPTAVFAANDVMALGALEALDQVGLNVPDDISIIGHDNIPNLHLLKVPLTTIAVPFHDMGLLAANKLLQILAGEDSEMNEVITTVDIRKRKSVKDIN